MLDLKRDNVLRFWPEEVYSENSTGVLDFDRIAKQRNLSTLAINE